MPVAIWKESIILNIHYIAIRGNLKPIEKAFRQVFLTKMNIQLKI